MAITIENKKITHYQMQYDTTIILYKDLELFKKEMKEVYHYDGDLNYLNYHRGKHLAVRRKGSLHLFCFAGTLPAWVHEISHCVTTLMEEKGITDDEFRSYNLDFLFSLIYNNLYPDHSKMDHDNQNNIKKRKIKNNTCKYKEGEVND